MKNLLKFTEVSRALSYLKEDNDHALQQLLELCAIPAPSHQEKSRAEYVLHQFREIGLQNVYMDEVYNVFGVLPGSGNGPRVMLAAHTDTVFPGGTDLTVHRDGTRYSCPGISDDTRAVAELLSVARAMVKENLRGNGDIVFCANVCEEGLGDLKGVKHIFSREHGLDAFVSIDNPVVGGIVYQATGSQRYQISFHSPGGHSFADFGMPNAIHAMGRAIAEIADFQAPLLPKTTFNVGVIRGGTSVNTISESAEMLEDIRSDSPEELHRLVQALKEAVHHAADAENARWSSDKPPVTATITLMGLRPAGTQSPQAAIVQAAWDAALVLGIEPQLRDETSTDANIPIALGIPAITVGRGGDEAGNHTLHEWHDPTDAYLGSQKNLLLTQALIGY